MSLVEVGVAGVVVAFPVGVLIGYAMVVTGLCLGVLVVRCVIVGGPVWYRDRWSIWSSW